MLIRKIRPGDNEEVAQIIRNVMTEFGAVGEGYSIEDPEVDAMYEAYLTDRSVFYVLQDREQLVGCGGVAPLVGAAREVCELKKMYFLPAARGQGLGGLLCETLIMDARRLEYRSMYIETLQRMTAANGLYTKMGFERIDTPLGNTGHCGCDTHYLRELEPQEIDPSLLI